MKTLRKEQHNEFLIQQAKDIISNLMVSEDGGETYRQAFPLYKEMKLRDLIEIQNADNITKEEQLEIAAILKERIPREEDLRELCDEFCLNVAK